MSSDTPQGYHPGRRGARAKGHIAKVVIIKMVAWIETVCYNPRVESAQTVGDPVAPDRAEASDTSGAVLSISPVAYQSETERVVAALDRLSDRLDEITAAVARSPFLSKFLKVRS